MELVEVPHEIGGLSQQIRTLDVETMNLPEILQTWQKFMGNRHLDVNTMSPSCLSITIVNVVTVKDKSIVICSSPTSAGCPAVIPAACPAAVTPADYVNYMAIVNALVAQTGVQIRFEWTYNGVANYVDVPVNLNAGDNVVYAFFNNIQYPLNTVITLTNAGLRP